MGQLTRFARLPRRDQALFVVAALLIATFRLAILLLPFRIVREWTHRMSVEPSSSVGDAVSIGRIVDSAARRVPFSNCLASALAGQVLMSRSGVRCEIRFGVAREADGRITAHAWVESNGQAVIGATDLDRFAEASGKGHVV